MGPLGLALAGLVLAATEPVTPLSPLVDPAAQTLEPVGPRPHLWLALGETTVAVGAAVIWYYRDLNFNAVDFDYTWSTNTWKQKLITFQADRFDDNRFNTNVFWHPFDGTGVYLIWRGNRFGPWTALAATTVMSLMWEYLVEYREVAAINDMIFTPVAGIAIGEPMIRTAALLREGMLGPVGQGLAALLDPIGTVNNAFEGGHRRGGENLDAHGLPLRYGHRLQFATGAAVASFSGGQTRDEMELGADLLVDATPELASPGHRDGVAGAGVLTWLAGGGAIGDGKVVAASLDTKLSIVGRQTRQAEGPDELLVTRARRTFWGLGSGFEYWMRGRPNAAADYLGIAKLLGPLATWRLEQGPLCLQAMADATYDFALVTSMGLDGYEAADGTVGLPNVLIQKRYYYAQGFSGSLRLLAQYGRWELGAVVREDDFWWIHGRNRIEPATPGPPGSDRRGIYRAWLGLRPWKRLPFDLTLEGRLLARSGSLGAASASESEMRASLLFGLLF
jgi:hypothetical protein